MFQPNFGELLSYSVERFLIISNNLNYAGAQRDIVEMLTQICWSRISLAISIWLSLKTTVLTILHGAEISLCSASNKTLLVIPVLLLDTMDIEPSVDSTTEEKRHTMDIAVVCQRRAVHENVSLYHYGTICSGSVRPNAGSISIPED